VSLLRRFSLLVPKDWQKRPLIDQHEQEVERRSNDPQNRIIRRWIDMADVTLRADDEEEEGA